LQFHRSWEQDWEHGWEHGVKRQSESSPTIFGVPALKLVVFEAPSV
jgi:hypothetical protein